MRGNEGLWSDVAEARAGDRRLDDLWHDHRGGAAVRDSRSTFYRWLKDAAFQAAYREARRAVVQHAMTQLQRATGEAVETLRRVMQNSESPASARVAAAKAVLETAVKGLELEDLEARIAALEYHHGEGHSS